MLSFRASEHLPNWYLIEGAATDACVEGTLAEMRDLAGAIRERAYRAFHRCAVDARDQNVNTDLAPDVVIWSPANSTTLGHATLEDADQLAAAITAYTAPRAPCTECSPAVGIDGSLPQSCLDRPGVAAWTTDSKDGDQCPAWGGPPRVPCGVPVASFGAASGIAVAQAAEQAEIAACDHWLDAAGAPKLEPRSARIAWLAGVRTAPDREQAAAIAAIQIRLTHPGCPRNPPGCPLPGAARCPDCPLPEGCYGAYNEEDCYDKLDQAEADLRFVLDVLNAERRP